MSLLSDIGNSIISAATGQDASQLAAQAQAAEQQLQIAIGTMIALETIIALELLVMVSMGWKARHRKMAVPQSQQDLAPKGRQAVTYSVPGFVKTFASPGIDSVPDETGVFASGAGLRPDSKTFKIYPWDWYNESSSQ